MLIRWKRPGRTSFHLERRNRTHPPTTRYLELRPRRLRGGVDGLLSISLSGPHSSLIEWSIEAVGMPFSTRWPPPTVSLRQNSSGSCTINFAITGTSSRSSRPTSCWSTCTALGRWRCTNWEDRLGPPWASRWHCPRVLVPRRTTPDCHPQRPRLNGYTIGCCSGLVATSHIAQYVSRSTVSVRVSVSGHC